jgi:hypothetical protein
MPNLYNRAAVTVSSTAIIVVAANATRKKVVICQTSANAVRVGALGVLATTGIRLAQGEKLVLEGVDCPTDAIYAIREGASDGTVSAIEVAES